MVLICSAENITADIVLDLFIIFGVFLNKGSIFAEKSFGFSIAKDIKGAKTLQRFEVREDQKTNCLTSVQKDNFLLIKEATKQGYCEISPGECVDLTQPNSKTRRGRKMVDKSNCLTAGNFNFCHWNGYRIRRLTEIECERLQTLPDNYTKGVSSSQRLKMLGNGWTRDVLAHAFSYLDNPIHERIEFQPDMFGFEMLKSDD